MVIEEVRKGNACVEESKYNAGCLLGIFYPKAPTSHDCPANEEELIKLAEKAYGEYPLCKLNHVWLTLQSCFNMIIENDGGNDYKIPHMGKESLE